MASARAVHRDELYRLVWSEPMIKVAKRYGVSGSYMARVCTLLNVPRPRPGYWAKVAVGRAPPCQPLPDLRPGDPVLWGNEEQKVLPPRPEVPPPRPAEKRVRITRHQTHALIRGANAHFENSRTAKDDEYLKPFKRLLVDVTTSKRGLEKALQLANDLFVALESVGHRVLLASAGAQLRRGPIDEREAAQKPREKWQHSGLWAPQRPTITYVGTVAIGLAVVEMSEHVALRYVNGGYIRESEYVAAPGRYRGQYSWTTMRDVPSGRIKISAYSPYPQVNWTREWRECGSQVSREQIKTIMGEIEAAAPELVDRLKEADRLAEIRRYERLAEQDRRDREEDRRRVAQSIAESTLELRALIERWTEVTSTERFLNGVESRANHLPEVERQKTLERLALARAALGNQDPLEFLRQWKTPEERYTRKYLGVEEG